jgi:hypothetical protein
MPGGSKVTLPIFFLTNFPCGSWDAQRRLENGILTLRGKLGAIFSLVV